MYVKIAIKRKFFYYNFNKIESFKNTPNHLINITFNSTKADISRF